ncbi:MAG: tetratricopeptide repeat protein [Planctomycetaceae bacterium]|nr:tetratricopeptide repeat protein [Planctomycetaceae bacterium]
MGDRDGRLAALGNLGVAHRNLGNPAKAVSFHELALRFAREIGDRREEANCLGNLGTCFRHLGELEKALICRQQRLEISNEIGDIVGQ